jgi:hypothetical protein
MNQQLVNSCNDIGEKLLTVFEFDGTKITKNLCQECINFIKNSKFGKIISLGHEDSGTTLSVMEECY